MHRPAPACHHGQTCPPTAQLQARAASQGASASGSHALRIRSFSHSHRRPPPHLLELDAVASRSPDPDEEEAAANPSPRGSDAPTGSDDASPGSQPHAPAAADGEGSVGTLPAPAGAAAAPGRELTALAPSLLQLRHNAVRRSASDGPGGSGGGGGMPRRQLEALPSLSHGEEVLRRRQRQRQRSTAAGAAAAAEEGPAGASAKADVAGDNDAAPGAPPSAGAWTEGDGDDGDTQERATRLCRSLSQRSLELAVVRRRGVYRSMSRFALVGGPPSGSSGSNSDDGDDKALQMGGRRLVTPAAMRRRPCGPGPLQGPPSLPRPSSRTSLASSRALEGVAEDEEEHGDIDVAAPAEQHQQEGVAGSSDLWFAVASTPNSGLPGAAVAAGAAGGSLPPHQASPQSGFTEATSRTEAPQAAAPDARDGGDDGLLLSASLAGGSSTSAGRRDVGGSFEGRTPHGGPGNGGGGSSGGFRRRRSALRDASEVSLAAYQHQPRTRRGSMMSVAEGIPSLEPARPTPRFSTDSFAGWGPELASGGGGGGAGSQQSGRAGRRSGASAPSAGEARASAVGSMASFAQGPTATGSRSNAESEDASASDLELLQQVREP